MKTWHKKYEWTSYAACSDSVLHTAEYRPPPPVDAADTPGSEMTDLELDRAAKICEQCKVRPECIEWAIQEKASAVVVAGIYLPDPALKRELRMAYQYLQKSMSVEKRKRGDV